MRKTQKQNGGILFFVSLQDYDKERLVSNGHVVAWRAAHWANWHFEIEDYSWEEGAY